MTEFKKSLSELFGGVFWFVVVTNIILYGFCNFFNFHSFALPYLFPNQNSAPKIAIITIDDESLKEYGKWPWPRDMQAKVLSKILDQNPKKLGLDILYTDLSNNNQEDSKLSTILKKPEVVSASQLNNNSTGVFYESSPDINTGFIEFSIDSNSFVRKAMTKSGSNFSLVKKMAETDNIPDSFLINPRTSRSPVISVKNLMENPNIGKILNDKYVLFGASAMSLNDFHDLPGLGQIPGVSIHGLVLQQILDNQYWQEIRFSGLEFLSTVLVIAFGAQFFFNKFAMETLKKTIILCNIGALIAFLSFILNREFIDLNFITPIIGTNFLLPISLWVRTISDEKENIKQALSLYISPKVMQKIMEDPSKVNLGGKKYSTSIMFTDIRGFTSMSEATENVSEIAKLLNQVLGLQTEVVLKNDGVIDKYIGDAVMAFWGAPIESDNYAYQAILSACQIQDRIHLFNQKYDQHMAVGVGINTGISLVGNFGSNKRFDYTAIGDTVNTAARIEGVTKHYKAKIIVSESTLTALTKEEIDQFWVEELDTIRLKGKNNPIKLFEIIGQKKHKTKIKPELSVQLLQYQECLKAYYQGDFNKAISLCENNTLQRASLIKQRSIEMIRDNVSGWDGIWNLDHK